MQYEGIWALATCRALLTTWYEVPTVSLFNPALALILVYEFPYEIALKTHPSQEKIILF